MLGFLAREMQKHKQARVHVPQSYRDATLGSFDRFTREQVEEYQLEAERLARDSQSKVAAEYPNKAGREASEPLGGIHPSTEMYSPHIEAFNYARRFVVPNYQAEERGTPYEQGIVRAIARHWLEGFFAACEHLQPTNAVGCGPENPSSPCAPPSDSSSIPASPEAGARPEPPEAEERRWFAEMAIKSSTEAGGRAQPEEIQEVEAARVDKGTLSEGLDLPHRNAGDTSTVIREVKVNRRPSDDAFRFFTGGTIELLRLSRADALRVAYDILDLAGEPSA